MAKESREPRDKDLKTKTILIGGSSHTGKTTLALALGKVLDWEVVSTDLLARHPGRPWRTNPGDVPPHVAEHYLSLSAEELIADVLRHYQKVWRQVEVIVLARTLEEGGRGLIVEGSAIWPAWAHNASEKGAKAIWLTAPDMIFKDRIYKESGFDNANARSKKMISKFLSRTLLFDSQMMRCLQDNGLLDQVIDQADGADNLIARVREMLDI